MAEDKEEIPVDDKSDLRQTALPAIEKQELMTNDTSEEFAEIFGSKPEFDSWDEFTTVLEEFQKKTGSSFKPRSASSVDYANERRISAPIPERFVYANVKMICVHYGLPTKRGTGHRKSYVGKGCGAFINVSFNRGALRITQSYLIHNNHPLLEEGGQFSLRQLRTFNFTDELDLIIAQEVLKNNPFKFTNGEKKWIQVVDNLQNDHKSFSAITPRLVKKRIRFLVDKFLAVSHGKCPTTGDELGTILYTLDKTRQETRDNPASRGRKPRGPGRPCKKRNLSPYTEDDEGLEDGMSQSEAVSASPVHKRYRPPATTTALSASSANNISAMITSDITAFLTFLEKRDEEIYKLRKQEIELRREEIAIHRTEIELQKQRFELEKMERKAHLEMINVQLRHFHELQSHTTAAPAAVVKPQTTHPLKDATGQVTEYTIVLDNNQVFEAVPGLNVGVS